MSRVIPNDIALDDNPHPYGQPILTVRDTPTYDGALADEQDGLTFHAYQGNLIIGMWWDMNDRMYIELNQDDVRLLLNHMTNTT